MGYMKTQSGTKAMSFSSIPIGAAALLVNPIVGGAIITGGVIATALNGSDSDFWTTVEFWCHKDATSLTYELIDD